MGGSVKPLVTWFLFCSLLRITKSLDDNINGNPQMARGKVFGKHPGGGLVSFNSENANLQIDWAVTIPFVSIPLESKMAADGVVPPLLRVNPKGLGIVGLIATLFTALAPLFSKKHPHHNYRSEGSGQWSQIGASVNEMIFGNNYVAPCMQRVVCSVVSVASHADNPTSIDKIIDGLSSHKWFEDVTNGTIIQDAVLTGRNGGHDCARAYNDCSMNTKLLKTLMHEFGIA